MAKLTGYDPDPALQALADLTTAIVDKPAPQKTIAKVKPKAKRKRGVRRPSLLYRDLEAAAQELARRLKMPPAQPSTAEFIRAQVDAMKRGFFDPLYWIQAEELWTSYLTSDPVNTLDLSPPPYAYRDPDNAPSRVTYPDGQTGFPPARYHGRTQFHAFRDLDWTWRKTLFRLAAPITPNQFEPTILHLAGPIVVDADRRGSRPMFSVVARVYIGDENNPDISTLRPPLTRAFNFLWRYRPPPASPPYYHVTDDRILYASVNSRATYQPFANLTHALVTSAPMPMKGRRFNNNTRVSTAAYLTPTLYQLRPAAVLPASPIAYEFGPVCWTYNRDTGEWETHNAPDLTGFFAVREDLLLTYSYLYAFSIQDEQFAYITTFPEDPVTGFYFAGIYPAVWGWGLVYTDWGSPQLWYVTKLTPEGDLIENTTPAAINNQSNLIAFAAGYSPFGYHWGFDPYGLSADMWLQTAEGKYAGWVHTGAIGIAKLYPCRTGIFAWLTTGALWFWPWAADAPEVTYPLYIANFIDTELSFDSNWTIAPTEAGLWAMNIDGETLEVDDTFATTIGPGADPVRPMTNVSKNLMLLP